MISVRLASCLTVCSNNFNLAVFLDTVNMINIKLCIMVVLTEPYPLIPLSVTLMYFKVLCQTVLTETFIFLSD